jgi:type VI secretion system secreted protein VgrG
MPLSPTTTREKHIRSRGRRTARLSAGVGLAALVPFLIYVANSANAADTAVDLGTAKSFSVLAGSGVTNTGVTTLAGSIGSYETPTITTDTPFVFSGAGVNHTGDAVTQGAKADLLTAYNIVAGAASTLAVPAELNREDPYLPGVYTASSSMQLTGAITLDGGGRNDGVFVFQAPSTLTTASSSVVNLTNGAQACNVYWQVGSSATFGTGTHFVGNVLAYTSITATTGSTFDGRLLANFGAVTLDTNTIVQPGCETEPGGGTDTDGAAVTAIDATEATDADGTAVTAIDATDATDATDAGTDTDATDATDAGTDTAAVNATEAVAATDAGTDTDSVNATEGTATDAGTDTEAINATEAVGATEAGTDTDSVNAGTDTDSVNATESTNATDTGVNAVDIGPGTDSVNATESTNATNATDTGVNAVDVGPGIDSVTGAGAGAESVAGTTTEADVQSATDSQIGTDTDSATGTDSVTQLPDTGGPGLLPLLIGLFAAVGGMALIVSAAHTSREE